MSESLDTVQRVLDLMKETFGEAGPDGVFRTYYEGDPEAIPLFNLPALIVTQTGDDTVEGSIGQDDQTDRLTIKIVLNKADDYNGDKVDPLNMTERKIRQLVGKADPITRNYEVKTVKYALRNSLLDGFTAIAPEFSVEYGINPRPSGKGLADLTAEGHVNFTIQFTLDTE